MDFKLHVPRCVSESRGKVQLPPMRRIAIERRHEADPIGCWLPTPSRLLDYSGRLGGMQRLRLAGTSLMEALEDRWPDFHYSLPNGSVPYLTAGTTIFVTGRTRGDGETLVATWDYGEPILKPLGRLNQQRQLLASLPPDVAYSFMRATDIPDVPTPQALLSDCIGVGERVPQTSLFGCGGGAPVSVAVGVEQIHLVCDHRLIDPPQMMGLANAFLKHMAAATAGPPTAPPSLANH